MFKDGRIRETSASRRDDVVQRNRDSSERNRRRIPNADPLPGRVRAPPARETVMPDRRIAPPVGHQADFPPK
jgi:hypothetical protein